MTAANQEQGSAAMAQAQEKAKLGDRRKALSPELREVLNMLSSLEAELSAKQAASR